MSVCCNMYCFGHNFNSINLSNKRILLPGQNSINFYFKTKVSKFLSPRMSRSNNSIFDFPIIIYD